MPTALKKSDLQEMPQFYDRYIRLVDDMPVIDALVQYGSIVAHINRDLLHELGSRTYAPGKWTAKNVLQHLLDTERILAYRALRFARNDQTHLQGFDETAFGNYTDAETRTVDDLLAEFTLVRQCGITLFKSFTDEMLYRVGTSNHIKISVLALGFVLAGHPIHHINILEERYFPLLSTTGK